jgi:hypothetical protein
VLDFVLTPIVAPGGAVRAKAQCPCLLGSQVSDYNHSGYRLPLTVDDSSLNHRSAGKHEIDLSNFWPEASVSVRDLGSAASSGF